MNGLPAQRSPSNHVPSECTPPLGFADRREQNKATFHSRECSSREGNLSSSTQLRWRINSWSGRQSHGTRSLGAVLCSVALFWPHASWPHAGVDLLSAGQALSVERLQSGSCFDRSGILRRVRTPLMMTFRRSCLPLALLGRLVDGAEREQKDRAARIHTGASCGQCPAVRRERDSPH
jgi:hypothetical protein